MKTYCIKDGGEEWRIKAASYADAVRIWKSATNAPAEPESVSLMPEADRA